MRCGPAQALEDEANYGAFAHIEGFQSRLLGKQLQSLEGLLANLRSTLCVPSQHSQSAGQSLAAQTLAR